MTSTMWLRKRTAPAATRLFAAACALLLSGGAASAQTADNVAVVINENSPDSITIGEHYVARRSIPAGNVIRISVPPDETMGRAAFAAGIEGPIARAFTQAGLQDRILYIVLVKGVPLRVAGTIGPAGTAASVDSELTLLYRKMTGRPVPPAGPLENPFFSETADTATTAFSRGDHDLYLVTRLDGLTVEDVVALIDRGLAPGSKGGIVFDQRGDARTAIGDRWMSEAAEALATGSPSTPVILEQTAKPAATADRTLGYFSWGATDPALRDVPISLPLVDGSIAATLGSNDAASMKTAPKGPRPFAAELIRAGATGVGANVAEPYLRSSFRPQVLFPAYLSGLPLADAFYRALPHVSWQAIVIGDPLVRPFGKSMPLTQLDAEPDGTTGLPRLFLARRLEALRLEFPRIGTEALQQLVASETHQVRGDRTLAIAALERATELAPDAASLHLRLATLHEDGGNGAEAVAGYRRVIALEPRNAIALNNLAYALATREAKLDEAAGFARKARALTPDSGTVADTLGWIEHLRGNRREAMELLREAAKRSPNHPEIRLHAAFALAEGGALAEARNHLAAALKADSSLEGRADVQGLIDRLRK